MPKPIENPEAEVEQETRVETVESIDDDADDSAEILQDAQELAENDQTEVKENESYDESVKQALKDISKDQSAGGEGEEESAEIAKAPEVVAKAPETEAPKKKPVKEEPFEPDLLPPEQLKLEDKELLNRCPKDIRRGVNRIVKGMQAEMTRAQQDSAKVIKEWSGLDEACRPFAAEFARVGMTIPQGVLQLLASQKALTDPRHGREAYIFLGKDLGLIDENQEKALRGKAGEAGATADISNHPEVIALKNEIKGLREKVDPIHNGVQKQHDDREAAVVDSITAELQSVIDETDRTTGKYLNPKLHDSEFLEPWKQLTAAIARTDKTVKSWKEAGKKAYDRMTGRSSSPGPVTPSSRNNRTVSPSFSTRGRSTVPVVASRDESAVPANETPEQSARIVLEELRRGI